MRITQIEPDSEEMYDARMLSNCFFGFIFYTLQTAEGNACAVNVPTHEVDMEYGESGNQRTPEEMKQIWDT